MDLDDFAHHHLSALEADAVRHNLMVAAVEAALAAPDAALRVWSLGGPGACAVQTPGRSIILGDLDADRCRAFAAALRDDGYPGVIGPDRTAQWFVEEAERAGSRFGPPIAMWISAIREAPRHPGVPGRARPVEAGDGALFAAWVLAFWQEVTPHDPRPDEERLARSAGDGRYLFWTVGGEPVAMAGLVRRTRQTAAIGGVYVPPALRSRGYGGSVTAALVDKARAEGRRSVCLFVDQANPASNRCYEKIGFHRVCASRHYLRTDEAADDHG